MLTRLFKVIHWIGTLMLLHFVLAIPVAVGISVFDQLTYTPPAERELKGEYTDAIIELNRQLEEAARALARQADIARGLDPDVEAEKRAEARRNRTFFERMPDPEPDELWPETEVYVFDYELRYPHLATLAYICGVIIAYIGTGRLTLLPWRIR